MTPIRPDQSELVEAFLREISDWPDFMDLSPLHVNSRREPYGNTPLKIASVQGDTPLVEALLAAGADVNARNEDDMTALHYAVSQGHADVVRVLMLAGADPNRLDRYERSPLDYADTAEMRELLLDHP
jgi:ankyrin repeat protein